MTQILGSGAVRLDGVLASASHVSSLGPRLEGAELSLDQPTRDRWDRLRRRADRDAFLAVRLLAADLVREILQTSDAVTFEQRCETCGGPHGCPRVSSHAAVVSWAHTSEVVAAAAAAHGALGIDVEHIVQDATVPDLRLPGRAFVRAEALVKAGAWSLDEALTHDLTWPWGVQVWLRGLSVVDVDVDVEDGAPGMTCIGALTYEK